jgi:hypothetical protein
MSIRLVQLHASTTREEHQQLFVNMSSKRRWDISTYPYNNQLVATINVIS